MQYQKTQTDHALDAIIHALQNLPTFNIFAITDEVTGETAPWYEVNGPDIADELVIRESRLAQDIMLVSVRIMEWGRLSARAQRIWEIEQRRERKWKANLIAGKVAAGEKLTEKAMEAIYRAEPKYDEWKSRVVRAAEAVNASQAVLDGFRAKKEMLKAAVRPAVENGRFNPQFAVP